VTAFGKEIHSQNKYIIMTDFAKQNKSKKFSQKNAQIEK
jgi:hypothetical protein